jgi:type II secretory pathway component PulF
VIIFTPRQFTQRAELYHQLAQLTGAGIGLLRSLEQLQRNPPASSFRGPLRQLILELGGGYTFTESLRRVSGWLPEFDIALLQAGETSGRLDVCFSVLADYYEDRARVMRQMIADLAYPVALFHFAIFIFPFPDFFRTGDVFVYAVKTFGILLPIYAVVALIVFACQGRHGEGWRSVIEKILRPVPLLGSARQYLALARLSGALEALISAGVTIIEAWELASRACGSPEIRRNVATWKRELLGGVTPAEMVKGSRLFPEMFEHLYTTGEQTGKLDESLRNLHRYYQEEGGRKMHAAAQWFPRLVYLLIALAIGYKVITFWTGYFKMIQDAGGF